MFYRQLASAFLHQSIVWVTIIIRQNRLLQTAGKTGKNIFPKKKWCHGTAPKEITCRESTKEKQEENAWIPFPTEREAICMEIF